MMFSLRCNALIVILLVSFELLVAQQLTSYPISGGSLFGVAVDAEGYMYGTNGPFVLKLAPNGTEVPFHRTETVYGALHYPYSLTINATGTVFVVDTYGYWVIGITPAGQSYVFGNEGDLNIARGIALDTQQHVYVCDTLHHAIVKISPQGNVTNNFKPLTSNGTSFLSSPTGIDVDSAGNLFVVDSDNNQIVKLNSQGQVIVTFSNQTVPSLQLNQPFDIKLDSAGNMYVSDQLNLRVVKLSSDGTLLVSIPMSGNRTPYGLWLMESNSELYVAMDGWIYKYDISNIPTSLQTSSSSSPFYSSSTASGFVNASNRVYSTHLFVATYLVPIILCLIWFQFAEL